MQSTEDRLGLELGLGLGLGLVRVRSINKVNERSFKCYCNILIMICLVTWPYFTDAIKKVMCTKAQKCFKFISLRVV